MKFSKQYSGYTSEITQFIEGLKKKNPGLEESQREGRALLWDKPPVDLEVRQRALDSKVAQQAYVYQTKG